MKDSIYLDASFFTATQIENHPHRIIAINKLQKLKGKNLCFSFLTLDEIAHSLNKYIPNKSKIADIIRKDLLELDSASLIGVETSPIIANKYIRLWEKSNLAPRDTFHVLTMKQNGIKRIATFDNDFIKNQKQLGIEVV